MGLDVYLYHYKKPFEEVRALEKAAEQKYEELGEEVKREIGMKDYDSASEELRDKYWDLLRPLAVKNGLTKWGEYPTDDIKIKVEFDSKQYPDHYFKVGYFRSSYNESGINKILQVRLGKRIESIFDVDPNEYYVNPDWSKAISNARALRQEFAEYLEENGSYEVIEAKYNEFCGPPNQCPIVDSNAALKAFLEEKKTHAERVEKWEKDQKDYNYTNRVGQFFMAEPYKMVGVIGGVKKRFFVGEFLPCAYIIVENKHGFEWYLHALDIIVETCEYVLGQDDPENYILHWSG